MADDLGPAQRLRARSVGIREGRRRLTRARTVATGATARWYRIGLVAAAMLVVGSGWYQMLTIPPYYAADEQAHVGYVLSLESGRLPTIDTPIDAASGGEDLQQQVARSRERQRDVWVANNPPLAYVAAIPAAVTAQALGLPGGPLLGLRFTNLVAFAVAVVHVGRLGRRLFGDDPVVGLGAAAAFAAVPHVGAIAGAGFVDGLALLCSVALAEVVVRMAQSAPTRRDVVVASAWCAAGAAVRPMTAVVAAVAAVLAWGLVALGSRRHRPSGEGGPGLPWSALVLAVPAPLAAGWAYIRNQVLYGDPTASEELFAKFTRARRAGGLREVVRGEVWADPLRTLLNRRLPQDVPSSPPWLWDLTQWAVAGTAAVATAVFVIDALAARRNGRSVIAAVGGPLVVAALSLVSLALSAQHWLGGGNIHPRYLFLPLAVLAALGAGAIVRVGRWVGVVGAVIGVLAIQAAQVPRQNRSLPRPGWDLLPASSPLTEPVGSPILRAAGVALVALAFAGWVVAVWQVRRNPTAEVGDR